MAGLKLNLSNPYYTDQYLLYDAFYFDHDYVEATRDYPNWRRYLAIFFYRTQKDGKSNISWYKYSMAQDNDDFYKFFKVIQDPETYKSLKDTLKENKGLSIEKIASVLIEAIRKEETNVIITWDRRTTTPCIKNISLPPYEKGDPEFIHRPADLGFPESFKTYIEKKLENSITERQKNQYKTILEKIK